MPHPTPDPARRGWPDERGFAFPLALLGLIVVTLLVTTALLTSSTEYAMSQAHADAAVDLYAVDGAAQRYLGLKSASAALSPPADSLHPVWEDGTIDGFLMSVTELQNTGVMKVGTDLVQDQTYALVAEPAGRPGRKVSMMVRTRRTAVPFDLTVAAGLTVGGDVKVTGSSVITDGRDAAGCDSTLKAENALQVTAGSTITRSGSATIIGSADTASYDKSELMMYVMGDLTLDQLSAMANIKFAPGTFSGKPSSVTSSGLPKPRTDKYNWGCPATESCASVPGNYDNTKYFPIVSIDAGGSTIGITGDYGQGVLIVRNGSLSITGNFVYHGIVLVEQDLSVKGAGGDMKLEGAVVSFGKNSVVDDLASGNSVIRFNQCSVTSAEEGANQLLMTTAPQIFRGPAFAWMEVL
jgi:hypothetical protein